MAILPVEDRDGSGEGGEGAGKCLRAIILANREVDKQKKGGASDPH